MSNPVDLSQLDPATRQAFEQLLNYLGTIRDETRVGTGSPENVVTAPVGTHYRRLDGGAGTSTYFKESGTGNTGWVAK